MSTETVIERTEVEFWTQQDACDPAEAALELRMEMTSAKVMAALFCIFGTCTLLGLIKLPDEHRLFWTLAELITSAALYGIMAWALYLVRQRKSSLREMEAQMRGATD